MSSELIESFLLGFVDGKRLVQKNSKDILIFSLGNFGAFCIKKSFASRHLSETLI